MTSILAFVFVLGVLIFVHELGHFIMARRIGVRVLTFSLGFGPKLLSFRRGDTEYCVSAIPLGGYVKMAGENPEDARTGASDEFLSKSKWQRFQVLIMGPVMNLALAVLVLTFVLYQGADVPVSGEQPVVVGIVDANSPAASAGIQPGDKVLAVNGDAVSTWNEYAMEISTRANRTVTFTIDRGGARIEKSVDVAARGKYEEPYVGMLPAMRPAVGDVIADGPAALAGVQRGDVILGVNGEKPIGQNRVSEIIQKHEGQPVALELERGGQPRTITVTPQLIDGMVRVGITFSAVGEFRTVQPSFPEAIWLSVQRNWETSAMILKTLGGLFTRDTQVRQLMGPVGIASLSGDALELGWLPLFNLMAMISLNLGLLNLMPVPVLDGGHIAILAIEGLSRRDFSIKVKEKMLLAGFVLLLMLMVTVIYNDLTRIQGLQKLMPWR